jgi:hypothetical protein
VCFPWSKEEFLDQALQVRHPFDDEVQVPHRVARMLYEAAIHGPDWVKRRRDANMAWYGQRATQLEAKERALHASLNRNVGQVVKDKRILLFKEMLLDIGYDDMDVVNLIQGGVKVVGRLKEVGIWKRSEDRTPRCEVKDLWVSARQSQPKVMLGRGSKDAELDDEVWACTMQEVEDGLLRGPKTAAEVSAQVGPLWTAARRFGIRQGDKVRPIDNFSEFGVNSAFGAEEKITMLGVDHVVAWSRAWLESEVGKGRFEVLDDAGQRWSGMFHDSWEPGEWSNLVGRVADLKSAYKQVAVHPSSAAFSIIAARDPNDGKVKLFEAISLMFGETAAVYAFLRISRALSAIATKTFNLLVVEFFDDFTQVECDALKDSSYATMEGSPEFQGIDQISEGPLKGLGNLLTLVAHKVFYNYWGGRSQWVRTRGCPLRRSSSPWALWWTSMAAGRRGSQSRTSLADWRALGSWSTKSLQKTTWDSRSPYP